MDDRVLFENDEWVVTAAGLGHKQKGYFIEREHLDARRDDGLWSWPLHMSEKSWCTPRTFAEAFMQAVLTYGVEPDADLAVTFLAAGRQDIERRVWEHVARDVGHRKPGLHVLDLDDLKGIGAEVRRRTGLGLGARFGTAKEQRVPERIRRSG